MLNPPKLKSLVVTRSHTDHGYSTPTLSFELPVQIRFPIDKVTYMVGLRKWDLSQTSYKEAHDSLFNRGSHFERMVSKLDGRRISKPAVLRQTTNPHRKDTLVAPRRFLWGSLKECWGRLFTRAR